MPLRSLQRRVARIVFSLPEAEGFALAGLPVGRSRTVGSFVRQLTIFLPKRSTRLQDVGRIPQF